MSADQSNKLANKLGAEAFWPMSLDKECEKATAIVRTFTLDGFQVKSKDRNGNNTKSLVKIPPKVLQNAKGLAIFTVFRTGFSLSGAGGSGILIARQIDGCELLVSSTLSLPSITNNIDAQLGVHLPAFSYTHLALVLPQS